MNSIPRPQIIYYYYNFFPLEIHMGEYKKKFAFENNYHVHMLDLSPTVQLLGS